jgi:hypothetical protein
MMKRVYQVKKNKVFFETHRHIGHIEISIFSEKLYQI